MPKVSLSTIKSWFLTGLKPTQTQFHNTWDSFWHKDDIIPTASIDGLDDTLNNLPTPEQLDQLDASAPVVVNVSGSATYQVEAGRVIEFITFAGTVSASVKVGLSASAGDIVDQELSYVLELVRIDYPFASLTTIHFTGTFTAKLYLR